MFQRVTGGRAVAKAEVQSGSESLPPLRSIDIPRPRSDSATGQCSDCQGVVSASILNCPDCGQFIGFPNVRAASSDAEAAALTSHYEEVTEKLADAGLQQIGDEFEEAVAVDSKAVFCRTLSALLQVATSEDDLGVPYYKLIEAGLRKGYSDAISRLRPIVDEAFFPGYYQNIRFAALTLDGSGPPSYGPCAVTIRSRLIANRSSVFDGNTLVVLLQEDARLSQLVTLPPGRRATWSNRGKLALCTFAGQLESHPRSADFPQVLLQASRDALTDQFIEVHIWGPITARAIESVELPKPRDKGEQVYVRAIQQALAEQGVRVVQSEAHRE